MYGCRGLGFDPVSVGTAVASFGGQVADAFGAAFTKLASIIPGVRQGADEADAIVPVQNSIAQRLGEMDSYIQNSTSLPQLQALLDEAMGMGAYFLAFLTDDRFDDGRASEQAANTLMPLIDGTGGYAWPEMRGYPVSADKWGNPTNGGRVGRLMDRILALGGMPTAPEITQGPAGPSLRYQQPSYPSLPQAGYLPPVSPLSPLQTAGVNPVGSGAALPLLVLGGVLLSSLSGRKRRR